MPNRKITSFTPSTQFNAQTIVPVVQTDELDKNRSVTGEIIKTAVLNQFKITLSLSAGASNYNLEEGRFLIGIHAQNNTLQPATLSVGNTVAGEDIVASEEIPANESADFLTFKTGGVGGSTLHFTSSQNLTLKLLIV